MTYTIRFDFTDGSRRWVVNPAIPLFGVKAGVAKEYESREDALRSAAIVSGHLDPKVIATVVIEPVTN